VSLLNLGIAPDRRSHGAAVLELLDRLRAGRYLAGMKRAAVVGAGSAGLAAAQALAVRD